MVTKKHSDTNIISNYDVISSIDYVKIINFHRENKAFATVALRDYSWQNPYGIVKTQGLTIKEFIEKPISNSFFCSIGEVPLSLLNLRSRNDSNFTKTRPGDLC